MSDDLLEFWQKALTLETGLCIETDDRHLLRQQLYRVRGAAKDPALDDIVILFPKAANELWLVRKNADVSFGNGRPGRRASHARDP